MKRILIISFLHSSPRQVGAIRTQRFAQYLPQFGWEPFVITRPSSDQISQGDVSGSSNTFFAPSIPLNKPYRLEIFTWIPFMLAKALKVLKRHQINVVLISCPPFHQALVGILLKKMLGIRLVIDYRDAWSLNPYYRNLDWFHNFILQGDRIMEERLLRNVDLLIVSHQGMQESYLRKFNFLKGRIEVIYNGFDPERIGSGNNSLFTEFTILHLGNFYAKHKTRNPDLFLTALREMISEQEILPGQLRVFFIGERYPEIERAIVGKGLSAFVSYIDRVPHDIAMEYLNKSHMLLLIETMDVMTTKVFEYLATGKPILALIGNKELKSLIERYSCNSYVILEPSLQTIKRDVSHCYRNYSANKPELLDDFRQGFSREVQTAILAGKLEKIANVERE